MTAQGKVSVERMCEIAQVSRAGFYREWRAREPTPAEMALRSAVQQAALRYRSYGYRRVMRLLRREGLSLIHI